MGLYKKLLKILNLDGQKTSKPPEVEYHIQSNNAIVNSLKQADIEHLFNILPEDLWRMILEIFVQNTSEYLLLFRTSPFFSFLFAAKRVTILLPLVVQAMLRHRECWEWTQDTWDLQSTGDDPRIHLKNFADYRLVSRNWKNEVEHILHNLPYHFYFLEEQERLDYQFPIQVFQKCSEVFESRNKLTTFESYFRDSHFATGTNPFITRAIQINIPLQSRNLRDAFMPSCLNVLRKNGHHVWYLTIRGNLDRLGPTQNELGHILRDVLQQVPNLKGLRFDMPGLPFGSWLPLDFTFPLLRNLVFFDAFALPSRIVDGILVSANPTKVGLVFHHETCSNAEIKFTTFCRSCTSVTTLRVDLHETQLDCEDIFLNMETRLGEKLTRLHISLPDMGLLGTDKKLKLPHLKLLDLELEDAVPLDFLLGMTNSLEEITVKVKVPMRPQYLIWLQSNERKLKVYKAVQLRQLCVSNAWDLFPNLKTFTVGEQEMFSFVVKCTRKEYVSNRTEFSVNSIATPDDHVQEETYVTILETNTE